MTKWIISLFIILVLSLFLGLAFSAHVSWLLYVSGASGLALLGTAVYTIIRKPKNTPEIELRLNDSEQSQLLQDSFNQGIESFNYLQDSLRLIQDPAMKHLLQDMQGKARKLFQYLERHPQKVALARRFIDYYQDTTASLVMKYVELEKTGLTTTDVEDIKRRTRQTLYNLNTAYTEQFAKIVSSQVMDMDAEIKVMNDSIAADGYHIQQDMPDFEDTSANRQSTTNTVDEPDFSSWDVTPRRKSQSFLTKISQKLFQVDPAVVKQKVIVSALAIFFGGFGAHKFYMGKTGWGILYLLFCWTGIPSLVGLIEGVRYFFMNGPEFERKYYRTSHYEPVRRLK